MNENSDESCDALRLAFELVTRLRTESPTTALGAHIASAADRFGLTSAQRAWMQWTLDPSSVAVQSKEPVREH